MLMVTSALVLSACVPSPPEPTPTPTAPTTSPVAVPTPTPTSRPTATSTPAPDADGSIPDAASLVISADGLGPLRLGMVASDSSMVSRTTTTCGLDDGAEFTFWTSTLPRTSNNALESESPVFDVGVDDAGLVYGISARDASITTPWGVGIGSTLDEVLAIPGVTEGPSGGVWRRLIVPGTPGAVVFDIGDHPNPEYWNEWQGRVTYVMVLAADRRVPAPNMHGPFPSGCL